MFGELCGCGNYFLLLVEAQIFPDEVFDITLLCV